MENSIEIPGYKVLVPNNTWGRKTRPVSHPIFGGKYPATEVLQIIRYTNPSNQEIISLIKARAKEYNPLSFLEEELRKAKEKEYIGISNFFEMLPEKEIGDIAKENKKTIKHLEEHILEDDCPAGTTYLTIISGRVPNEVLDIREKERHLVIARYISLITQLGNDVWQTKIRLNDKDKLPKESEISQLINETVYSPNTLFIKGDKKSYDIVSDAIKSLYPILSNQLIKIQDDYNVILATKAVVAIRETAKCLEMKKSLKQIAKDIARKFKERDNPFQKN